MDRYVFDKRVIKKVIIKYGIIFLCCIPILLGLNYVTRTLNFWVVVVIDAAVVLVIVFGVYLVEQLIKKRKQNKSKDVVVIKKKKK